MESTGTLGNLERTHALLARRMWTGIFGLWETLERSWNLTTRPYGMIDVRLCSILGCARDLLVRGPVVEEQTKNHQRQRNPIPSERNKGVGLHVAQQPAHHKKRNHCR